MFKLKKVFFLLIFFCTIYGCSKHDPVLPGTRYDIFDYSGLVFNNKSVPELSENKIVSAGDEFCPYSQNSANVIFYKEEKIFFGFPTVHSVKSKQAPVCYGNGIYTGLSTGEVIKIDSRTKKIVWVTDVYKNNNLTGGADIVDVVAHVVVDNGYVYAGGLGNSFCKIKDSDGEKKWCLDISVGVDFAVIDNVIFLVDTDNNFYALAVDDGSVYWKTSVKKQLKPIYKDGYITVGKQKINYKNGQ